MSHEKPYTLRHAYNDWASGNDHTNAHYVVDTTKFVGQVPAATHRAAEQSMQGLIPVLIDLIDDLAEDTECSFDHHGDCQTHGWFGLRDDGSDCPVGSARKLVKIWRDESDNPDSAT